MTDILETLRRVKSAAARRDLVPMHSCFHFYEGRVQAQNGAVCLDAPCALFAEPVTVNAEKFWRAAKLTKCEFKYNITKGEKLSISKSKFRALIPVLPSTDYPLVDATVGVDVPLEGFLELARRLRPFVSEDVSRPWSRSILLRDAHLYATNNVVLVRLPVPLQGEFSVPILAIDALLDLGMEPHRVTANDKSVSFFLPNDLVLTSRLMAGKWPDVESIIVPAEVEFLPDYFAETVENLIPFCDDPKFPMIVLGEHGISTSQGLTEATVDLGDFPECIFRAEPLLMVSRAATGIAFSSYPKPCYFEGDDGVEGMILGIMK